MKRIALMIALMIAPLRSGLADEPAFNEGDLVRVNCLNIQGFPTQLAIYPTRDDLIGAIRENRQASAERRFMSCEGVACLGHNTPLAVELAEDLAIDGTTFRLLRAKVTAGGLAGQRFWMISKRLRPNDTPDPAAKMFTSSFAQSYLYPSWDGDYEPKQGDRIMLAGRTPGDNDPTFATLIPDHKPGDMKAIMSGEQVCVRAGTRATVSGAPPTRDANGKSLGNRLQVKITSGPFEGLVLWAQPWDCARPEVYAQKIASKPAAEKVDK